MGAVLAGAACGPSVQVETSGAGSADGGSATSHGGSVMVGGASPAGGAGGAGASGGASPAGGAGGDEVCPAGDNPCAQCLSTECAATYCDCYDEIHCGGYLECLGTCMPGDAACAQSCAAVHTPGISAAILVADCAATTCDAACNFGQPLNDCARCLYVNCAEQMNACIADPECIALTQCVQTCEPGDVQCGQACVAEHPDGLPEAQDVRKCRMDACSGECE